MLWFEPTLYLIRLGSRILRSRAPLYCLLGVEAGLRSLVILRGHRAIGYLEAAMPVLAVCVHSGMITQRGGLVGVRSRCSDPSHLWASQNA